MTWLGAQPKVAETSTTTGTGDFTLAGAYDAQHTTFAGRASTGDTFPYAIVADDGKKERGTGTFSVTGTLQRTNPKAGWNGAAWVTNTLVSFAAGSKVVFMDYPDAIDSVAAGVIGGNVATSRVTLTATSPAAQKLTVSTPGEGWVLPDATTMPAKANVLSLQNDGDFSQPVFDSTGVIRSFVPARKTVSVSLLDASTAAGVWSVEGGALVGPTAAYSNASLAPGFAQFFAVALDTNRTMLLFGDSALYAIVYDKSTRTWGAATTVRASISSYGFCAIKSATEQVLVVSALTTALEAVTLTTSGTTITVNSGSKATATLAGNISTFLTQRIISVGSSWVFSYGRDTTTQAIRAITISTNTPTIGAETATSTQVSDAPHLYAVSSTVVLVLGQQTGTFAGYARPYTISAGTTLTAGTAQTFGTAANGSMRTLAFGTRWLMLWNESNTSISAALVSVSSGNATSSVVTSIIAENTSPQSIDAIACNGRIVVASPSVTAGARFDRINILTDTSGTLSKGTALALPNVNNTSQGALLGLTSTSVRFSCAGNFAQIGVTGASPTVITFRGYDVSTELDSAGIAHATFVRPSDPFGPSPAPYLLAGQIALTVDGFSRAVAVGADSLFFIDQPAHTYVDNYASLSSSARWQFGCNNDGSVTDLMLLEAAQP